MRPERDCDMMIEIDDRWEFYRDRDLDELYLMDDGTLGSIGIVRVYSLDPPRKQ